jgi:hypothetical protein
LQIDLKKAYTSIDRTRLLKLILSKYNFIYFHKLYNMRKTYGRVDLMGDYIDIVITKGVGEGQILSCHLFNIAIGIA